MIIIYKILLRNKNGKYVYEVINNNYNLSYVLQVL